jgi:DNA-binding transcriptional MerR regulator
MRDGAMSASPRVRIGELSRRTGVSVDALRVWERRYGLLRPERTAGGQRLYSVADEERVSAMRGHLAEGLSAAEAARLVTTEGPAAGETAADLAGPMAAAMDALDEPAAHAALDRLIGALGIERALSEVVIPYLRDLGDRWACAQVSVADEHFASRLLQGRLLREARGWDQGPGPRALLACPPGEEHDLGLIAFGIALHRRGWRITYLGANTPIDGLGGMVSALGVATVVLAATTPLRFADVLDQLRALSAAVPLALGGEGATTAVAEEANARRLEGDPVAGANLVAGTA